MKDLFKYKILLVDDRKENLFALSAVLKSAGYITESALSGSEALKLLLKNEYGLIILDVQMPIMSGFELAELIKGNSKTKDIPLIFLSANGTLTSRECAAVVLSVLNKSYRYSSSNIR